MGNKPRYKTAISYMFLLGSSAIMLWVFGHVDEAHSRGYFDDESQYYGDEGGIPDIAYLFLWVAICAAIASLYRLADRFNKKDEEISKKIFLSVVMASGIGGFFGFCITFGIVIITMIIDGIFDSRLLSFVGERTNLIVLFFAAVNVAGLNYMLRDEDDVIVQTRNMDINYRYDDMPNNDSPSNDTEAPLSAKKNYPMQRVWT